MNFRARNVFVLKTCMVLFLALLFFKTSKASTYTIEGIKVDVTSETSVAAREESFNQAQILAFNKLLRSIILKEDQNKIPGFEASEISNFISDYSVSDEKLTGTRYLATYQFSFDKEQVNQFLLNYGIQPTAFEPRKVLVLPVFTKQETIIIGEDFWHYNWQAALSKNSDDYVLPLFDLEDQFKARAFTEQNETSSLKELAGKYGADTVFVAWLKTKPEEENLYEVISYVLDDQHSVPEALSSEPVWALEEETEVQSKIKNLVEEFQEKEKHKAIHKKSLKRTIRVESPCSNLTCVNEVKNDLYSMKNVKEIKILEVSNKKITFNLGYEGKFKALQERLNKMLYNVKIEATGVLIEKVKQDKYDNS